MTPRRQSKRTTATNKRRLLEEKRDKRAAEAKLRLQRKKSKDLQQLHSQELSKFSEEALRLGHIVDSLYSSYPESEGSEEDSFKSLEWDDTEETPPSFVTDRTSSLLTDRSQSVVDLIIDDILSLDNPAECQVEPVLPEALDSGNSARRNTSTNERFLDEAHIAGVVPVPSNYHWPPRFPSQEPEDFNPFDSSSINQDLEPFQEEEVFDTEVREVISTMEEETYKQRVRAVKLALNKVKNSKKAFVAANVTSLDVTTYADRLKQIRDKLDNFTDIASELVVDLDGSNPVEQGRITELEEMQENIFQEVITNEN